MDDKAEKGVHTQPPEADFATGVDESAYPRADGGKDAYIVLAGAFVLEAVIWGFPGAYGVFLEYFSTHQPFESQKSGLSAIPTTANGIMYIASPVIQLILQRCPQYHRPLGLLGLAIMTAALIAASFSNTTGALLATQGVLYGIGGLAAYFPAIHVVDDWFIERKGFAFGVVLTGTGFGGAVLPFIFQWLLDSYGFRTATRVWIVVQFLFVLPAVLVMRRRLPETIKDTMQQKRDWSFLRKAPFWFFELGNLCISLGFFLPTLWLPSFAASIGLPSFAGSLAVCLLNVASCFGLLLHGSVVDKIDVVYVILSSSLLGAFAILVFWGLTTSQPLLYIFAIAWGLSGGGYAATWSGCAKFLRQLTGASSGNASGNESNSSSGGSISSEASVGTIDNGLIISLMCVSKGIGSIISGPISQQLLETKRLPSRGFAYDSEYGDIIIFAGVMAAMGGLAFVGRILRLL